MLIVYSSTFESVLYAVLLSNITDLPLLPKKIVGDSHYMNEYIDIDELDWGRVYSDHCLRFGNISWLNGASAEYELLQKHIYSLLSEYVLDEYISCVEYIRRAVKFGIHTLTE